MPGRTNLVLSIWAAWAVFLAGQPAAAQTRTPELDPVLHARALERGARLPHLRSLLVSVDGTTVAERYFHGVRSSHWANLKSASKSVISALVGIAIERGYLESVRVPIGEFFPEHLDAEQDLVKRKITIEDLLTMRSGLESTSRRNYGRWVQSGDWVRYVLSRPMVDAPAGRMIYSTGNTHLLSAILTKATGMGTFEFARRHLAEPLGIPIRPWTRDPQGIYFGGNEMHLTPRAMLAIGELYLNRGRAGDARVISEQWIRESFEARTRSQRSGREYGYGWWIGSLAGRRTFYAWGHGGQFIFVVPEINMVAVTTSTPLMERQERRAHRRAIYDLMEEEFVPAANGEGRDWHRSQPRHSSDVDDTVQGELGSVLP